MPATSFHVYNSLLLGAAALAAVGMSEVRAHSDVGKPTGLEQIRLDNGLTAILVPHRLAPVVAVQAWVGVGSTDEARSQAGIAHLTEHMLFKGTERRGPGDIAREVEAAGGDINAWTSFHRTVYHVVMASRYFRIGLDVLADALQNSTFERRELEREREVVIEEILQSRDDPMRNIARSLLATAFTEHPYGEPVIGSAETVRSLRRRHLEQFVSRWYVANNITLVVAGDFDDAGMKRAIADKFATMKSRPLRRRRVREPVQEAARAAVATQEVSESYVAVGFPIPGVKSPLLPALDLAALVLGQGESSRLTRSLRRDRELVTAAFAHAQPLRDGGLFVVSATTQPDKLAAATEAAAAETFALAAGDIHASELDRARRSIEADIIYQRETAQGMARKYGFYHATTGDPEFEAAYLERMHRLEPGDIRAALAEFLRPDRANLTAVIPGAGADRKLRDRTRRALLAGLRRVGRGAAKKRVARAGGRTGAIVRETLDSGMRVIVKPDPSVPVVAMRAVWPGGLRLETPASNGINHLLARMILRGCDGMSAEAVVARVDELTGGIAGVSGRNSFGLRAEWLAKNWEQGLELLARCISSPDFPADELAREKRHLLDEIRSRLDRPGFVAYRTFVEALYHKHPYRMDVAGTAESVAELDRRRLSAFYRRYFPVSGLTLAIVGDVDADRAIALCRRLFGGRPKRQIPPRRVPRERFSGRKAAQREVYRFVDRHQAHLVVGFPGTTVDHPDRHPLEVVTTILGGQGGRLFLELRDRQALAYSVSAAAIEGVDPGYVAVHLSCSPEKVPAALAGIRRELTRIASEPVTEKELERAKRYLVGTHEISLQRRSAVAAALAFHEAYGLGYREYQRYAGAIRSVSAADVQRVAAAYLDWELGITATIKPRDQSPEAARRSRGKKKRAPRTRRSRSRRRGAKR